MSAVPDPAAEWERYVAAQEYLYETVWRGIAGVRPEDGGALIEVAWIGDEFTIERRSAECVECGAGSAARGPTTGTGIRRASAAAARRRVASGRTSGHCSERQGRQRGCDCVCSEASLEAERGSDCHAVGAIAGRGAYARRPFVKEGSVGG